MTTIGIPYRTSLRVLGRILNGEKARNITICELDEGFLLLYCTQGDPTRVSSRALYKSELLDLDDMLRGKREQPDRFKGLYPILQAKQSDALAFQKSHPLSPQGYEEFLRAVGTAIDSRKAQAFMITEMEDSFVVEYSVDRADFVLRGGNRVAVPGRRQETYDAQGCAALIRSIRGHVAETVRQSGTILAQNPMDVNAWISAALALEDEGQDKDAEDMFRRVLKIDPEFAEVHYHLSRHARRRGDIRSALKHLQMAMTLRNNDPRFLHLMARIKIEQNNWKAASGALQQAIACDPDNPIYLYDLDRLNEQLTRKGDAPIMVPTLHIVTESAAPIPFKVQPAEQGNLASRLGDSTTEDVVEQVPEYVDYSKLTVEDAAPAASDENILSDEASKTEVMPTWKRATGLSTRLSPESNSNETEGTQSQQLDEIGMPLLDMPIEPILHSVPELLPSALNDEAVGLPLEAPKIDAEPAPEIMITPTKINKPVQVTPTENDDDQLSAQIMRTKELLAAEPERADLHRRLGFLLAKQGRSEEAAASFRRAVECGRRRMTGK